MEHIGGQLQKIEQNMRLNTADPIALHGFTQLPNFILRNPDLSTNAKTTYALLLSYAWHNNLCFPGQERLAEHMGTHVSTVSRVHHRARGVRPHRDRAPRPGQDQLLHHQFRREEEGPQSLTCTGASLDLHGWDSRFARLQFTLYKNMHLRILRIKNTQYWDAF